MKKFVTFDYETFNEAFNQYYKRKDLGDEFNVIIEAYELDGTSYDIRVSQLKHFKHALNEVDRVFSKHNGDKMPLLLIDEDGIYCMGEIDWRAYNYLIFK